MESLRPSALSHLNHHAAKPLKTRFCLTAMCRMNSSFFASLACNADAPKKGPTNMKKVISLLAGLFVKCCMLLLARGASWHAHLSCQALLRGSIHRHHPEADPTEQDMLAIRHEPGSNSHAEFYWLQRV